VAGGVLDAVADGVVARDRVDELLLIAAVWVDPAARDEALVYANNRTATRGALEAGANGAPPIEELMKVRDDPRNPFFDTS
jgi:5,6,7,8-tetrahydromethanopterin hydro-lyase